MTKFDIEERAMGERRISVDYPEYVGIDLSTVARLSKIVWPGTYA